MKSKALFYLFILLFMLISCKQQTTVTQSSSANANFQSGSCTIGKWSSSNLNLKLSSEFLSDFTNADLVNGLNPIEQMAKNWNTATSPTTTLFSLPFQTASSTGYSSLSSFRDGEFGIYKSHTWFSNVSSSALAITQFYGVVTSNPTLGTYIDLTHADIILNYRDYGAQFVYNQNSFANYDVPTVILHEMGHFLGLCHETTHSSIMAPYYVGAQRSLQTFDTNKIRALYINNQNYGVNAISRTNTLSSKPGTEVKGIVELLKNGKCRHYINGKLVFEHQENLRSIK